MRSRRRSKLCWLLESSDGFLIVKRAGLVTKMEYHAVFILYLPQTQESMIYYIFFWKYLLFRKPPNACCTCRQVR